MMFSSTGRIRIRHPVTIPLGGALAYGHPYGASGAIILLHLMRSMELSKKLPGHLLRRLPQAESEAPFFWNGNQYHLPKCHTSKGSPPMKHSTDYLSLISVNSSPQDSPGRKRPVLYIRHAYQGSLPYPFPDPGTVCAFRSYGSGQRLCTASWYSFWR